MNLSISNIGWSGENDDRVYSLMRKYGYTGLEIAPTRIFPVNPYERLTEAKQWADGLASAYGFSIPSMQSIWYGRTESIFGSEDERETLLAYTKKAVLFAESIGCSNLVFGCPKNRRIPEGGDPETAIHFFKAIGDYALRHHTVISLEANPPIYNTNFINITQEAIDLLLAVDSEGFLLNLDVGTMTENHESVSVLEGNVHLINHVHISEPGLKTIQKRDIHQDLCSLLRENKYGGFVSIEAGRQDDIRVLEEMLAYVAAIMQL